MFKEGDITPEFTIKTDTDDFKLNLKNDSLTVIFFFPRANIFLLGSIQVASP